MGPVTFFGKFFPPAAYSVPTTPGESRGAREAENRQTAKEREGTMETVNYKYLNYACLVLIAAAAFFLLDLPL